jgi:hypothetical protein
MYAAVPVNSALAYREFDDALSRHHSFRAVAYRPAWLLATASPLTKPSWLWRQITKGITAMTKPTINVSVYGENAPAGATFGKGAKTSPRSKK